MERRPIMRFKIQMVIDHEKEQTIQEVVVLEREDLSAETLGLTLKEAKEITGNIQKHITEAQLQEYLLLQKQCPHCKKKRSLKGYHSLTYRTLFGKLDIKSPRLMECVCLKEKHKSFSPLAVLLEDRTSPELLYLESKWASLMSYGVTANLLEEVFPIAITTSSVFDNTTKISTWIEEELPEEKYMFIDGCQNQWDALPRPDPPLTVGLDGGYVHARDGDNRKAGWFEVIVGKSLQEEQTSKRFGFVSTYDTKPKRRFYEMLKEQGLQENQDITFLTDGGETIRDLTLFLNPRSEHILDWFHITMKITVIKQIAKGALKKKYSEFEKEIDDIKWYLWHGNTYKALGILEFLDIIDEETGSFPTNKESKLYKLDQTLREFFQYIQNNRPFIPNYGERYRHGELISTSFAESTVNELVSRRMVKNQQMRWTKKGAHLLLQLRVKTLNKELHKTFTKWYPKMQKETDDTLSLAA